MDQNEFPGFSEYTNYKTCCCTKTKIKGVDATFCGEWEVSLAMPVFVIFMIISSYGVLIWGLYSLYTFKTFIIIFSVSVLIFVPFITSYFQIIKIGPGYLPFYYPAREILPTPPEQDLNTSLLSIDNCPPSGIISNNAQLEYAKSLERQPRCIVSKSARRIVIKPDHMCGWTATWIGKRNFKMFLLFNIYGLLYMIFYLSSCWKVPVCLLENKDVKIEYIFLILYMFFALNFLFMNLSFAWSGCESLIKNQTSWEKWNKLNMFDQGCTKNMKDVCGDGSICCYMCPTAPFNGVPNEQLIKNYVPYPEVHYQD